MHCRSDWSQQGQCFSSMDGAGDADRLFDIGRELFLLGYAPLWLLAHCRALSTRPIRSCHSWLRDNALLLLIDGGTRSGMCYSDIAIPGPEELNKYDFKNQGSYFGYKGLGGSVLKKDGKIVLDANEFYNVSKDDVLGNVDTRCAQPAMLQQHDAVLRSFIESAHQVKAGNPHCAVAQVLTAL